MNLPTIYELAALPLLFAQEKAENLGAEENAAGGDGQVFDGLWLPIGIMCVVYLFIMMIPRSGDKKAREMLDKLKKHDRVITAGGIFGTVTTVRKEDPFVMLRVDDSGNTRLKVLKTSISRVITGDEKSEKDASEPDGSNELKSV
ncbi:MAG: preprotein translocase subunit YajC [Planctomycetota bacterium]|jgi:preprotein translocase subunit YajC|nr:preprotein translocase subunit YajC [Planctomycetota bacterium]